MWDGANTGWWPVVWFIAKVWAFLFVFIWLRATLPRLRYDQFMALGWKVLIPVSLVWIMIVAVIRTLRNHGYDALDHRSGHRGLVVAAWLLRDSKTVQPRALRAQEDESRRTGRKPSPDTRHSRRHRCRPMR